MAEVAGREFHTLSQIPPRRRRTPFESPPGPAAACAGTSANPRSACRGPTATACGRIGGLVGQPKIDVAGRGTLKGVRRRRGGFVTAYGILDRRLPPLRRFPLAAGSAAWSNN